MPFDYKPEPEPQRKPFEHQPRPAGKMTGAQRHKWMKNNYKADILDLKAKIRELKAEIARLKGETG